MQQINEALSNELGNDYFVYTSYSYSKPFIHEGIQHFINNGIETIQILPLYPQSSFSTSESIIREIERLKIDDRIAIKICEEFYINDSFISFWHESIIEVIKKNNLNAPLLLFSAHSIPQSHVEQGDTYVQAIEELSQLIAESLQMDYKIAYQSKMSKMKWVEPDIKSVLTQLSGQGIEDIVIIPISFIAENLETLYDLDKDIIPFGKMVLNIKHLCRVVIPPSHPLLIRTLKESITLEL